MLFFCCRFHGSYEAIEGGCINEALVELTGDYFSSIQLLCMNLYLFLGGIGEFFETSNIKSNNQFWDTMCTALKHGAMIGCSTSVHIRFQFSYLIIKIFFIS
jgi:hypothetical protein